MRRQGREERHPMMQYPQATKLATVPFLSPTVRTTLKSHWQIRGQKGLWRFQAITKPDDQDVDADEIVAWFYPSYSGTQININYGRFYRDEELECILKKLV